MATAASSRLRLSSPPNTRIRASAGSLELTSRTAAKEPSGSLLAFVNPDSSACLSDDDLVAGLQAHASRTRRHRNRFAVPHQGRPMGAPVVRDAILPQRFGVLDVRVPSRYGVVGQIFTVHERHVIRSDQTIQAIANLHAPAEVDARK